MVKKQNKDNKHKQTRVKNYLFYILEPTLLFGPVTSILAFAALNSYVHILYPNPMLLLLLIAGSILVYMSINAFDDYVDFKKGIDTDMHNVKTKFSGGNEFIKKNLVSAKGVLMVGLSSLLAAALIAIYFLIINFIVLPFVLIGLLSIVLYSSLFSKIPFLSEPLTALNNVSIVVAGFIILGGTYSLISNLLFAAIPSGLAIGAVLMVNEVPDIKVDSKYGRRSSVVMLKTPKNVSYFFIIWQAVSWLIIASGIVVGALPYTSAIAFAVIPLAFGVYFGMRNYKSPKTYEKCMGLDVLYALIFILLISISYFI